MKTKQQTALIAAMKAGKLENQAQQNLIFKILNGADSNIKEEVKDFFRNSEFEGFELAEDQIQKGYDWLKNLWVTPAGAERKNNPYGYREQDALENFSHITLKGYYDAGNYSHSYYVPLYDVHTKDGYGFEYHMVNGTISIVG